MQQFLTHPKEKVLLKEDFFYILLYFLPYWWQLHWHCWQEDALHEVPEGHPMHFFPLRFARMT